MLRQRCLADRQSPVAVDGVEVDISLVSNEDLVNELTSRFDACVIITQSPADMDGDDIKTIMVHTGPASMALGMMDRYHARLLRDCATLDVDDEDDEEDDDG